MTEVDKSDMRHALRYDVSGSRGESQAGLTRPATAHQLSECKPMKLDRELQNRILTDLCDLYPDLWQQPSTSAWDGDEEKVLANLKYLDDHGLITLHAQRSISGAWIMSGAEATHKGVDFMVGDGGLSAILGVVTVRLHDDTIKSLIEARIHEADLPETEKKRYLDQLRELPAETTKHLVLKLVDLGLEQGPAAIGLIGKWLGMG